MAENRTRAQRKAEQKSAHQATNDSHARSPQLRKLHEDEAQRKAKPQSSNPPVKKQAPKTPSATRPAGTSPATVIWGWVDAVIMAAVLLIAQMISTSVMGNTLARLLPVMGKAGARFGLLTIFYVVEVMALSYLAHRKNLGLAQAFRLRLAKIELNWPEIGRSTLLVAGLLVATRGVGMLWTYVTSILNWNVNSSQGIVELFGTTSTGVILAGVAVVICAPVVEEMVFRGIVLNVLGQQFSSVVAVGISAGVFALYHGSLWAFVPHMALGVATGYLALTRKTLLPAILLHAAYNATLLAAAAYLTNVAG